MHHESRACPGRLAVTNAPPHLLRWAVIDAPAETYPQLANLWHLLHASSTTLNYSAGAGWEMQPTALHLAVEQQKPLHAHCMGCTPILPFLPFQTPLPREKEKKCCAVGHCNELLPQEAALTAVSKQGREGLCTATWHSCIYVSDSHAVNMIISRLGPDLHSNIAFMHSCRRQPCCKFHQCRVGDRPAQQHSIHAVILQTALL